MRKKIVLAWSGGKDSSLTCAELLDSTEYELVALLTTVTAEYERISMHGVRVDLLEEQGRRIVRPGLPVGLPVEKVLIPVGCTEQEYERRMGQTLTRLQANGVAAVAFGDIFLEDLRKYREAKLAAIGMGAIFPIWKRPTPDLARTFIARGFRTILTCVDSQKLDGRFVGRDYDESLLAELPPGVDPCGENGEFHTFVHAGPIFERPIAVRKGEIVLRDNRFWYCDVLEA